MGCNLLGGAIATGLLGVSLLLLGVFSQTIIEALMRLEIADEIPITSNTSQLYATSAARSPAFPLPAPA